MAHHQLQVHQKSQNHRIGVMGITDAEVRQKIRHQQREKSAIPGIESGGNLDGQLVHSLSHLGWDPSEEEQKEFVLGNDAVGMDWQDERAQRQAKRKRSASMSRENSFASIASFDNPADNYQQSSKPPLPVPATFLNAEESYDTSLPPDLSREHIKILHGASARDLVYSNCVAFKRESSAAYDLSLEVQQLRNRLDEYSRRISQLSNRNTILQQRQSSFPTNSNSPSHLTQADAQRPFPSHSQLLEADYPNIDYWWNDDWNVEIKSPAFKQLKESSNGISKTNWFLQLENGSYSNYYGEGGVHALRKLARSKAEKLPPKARSDYAEKISKVYFDLEEEFPFLRYCGGQWKAKNVMNRGILDVGRRNTCTSRPPKRPRLDPSARKVEDKDPPPDSLGIDSNIKAKTNLDPHTQHFQFASKEGAILPLSPNSTSESASKTKIATTKSNEVVIEGPDLPAAPSTRPKAKRKGKGKAQNPSSSTGHTRVDQVAAGVNSSEPPCEPPLNIIAGLSPSHPPDQVSDMHIDNIEQGFTQSHSKADDNSFGLDMERVSSPSQTVSTILASTQMPPMSEPLSIALLSPASPKSESIPLLSVPILEPTSINPVTSTDVAITASPLTLPFESVTQPKKSRSKRPVYDAWKKALRELFNQNEGKLYLTPSEKLKMFNKTFKDPISREALAAKYTTHLPLRPI